MATILIVEDELLIAEELAHLVTSFGHTALEPVDTSEDALTALAEHHPVDLVLMDININGECDGVATALLVRRQFAVPVVFLTALSDDATAKRAALAQPYGYLVKPISAAALRAGLQVALNLAAKSPLPLPATIEEASPASLPPNEQLQYFFVRRSGEGYVKIYIKDIEYIEAKGNYVMLCLSTQKMVVEATIKSLADRLPASFFKAHRSYIVNLDHVHSYHDGVVWVGKSEQHIPISRENQPLLKQRLRLLG